METDDERAAADERMADGTEKASVDAMRAMRAPLKSMVLEMCESAVGGRGLRERRCHSRIITVPVVYPGVPTSAELRPKLKSFPAAELFAAQINLPPRANSPRTGLHVASAFSSLHGPSKRFAGMRHGELSIMMTLIYSTCGSHEPRHEGRLTPLQ